MKRTFTLLFLSLLFVGITSAQKNLQILLVEDDEDATTTTEAMRAAITASGYTFTDYNAVTNNAPDSATMAPYELIIWSTGKNYPESRFWDKSNPEDIKPSAAMLSFLDNGGMLWISGLNVLYDGAGKKSAPQKFTSGSFIYDYLGVESYAVQAKLYSMLVTADNGICTEDSITWTWDYINYVDHAVPTSTAKSIYTSSTHPDTAVVVYNENGKAKILSDFIRWDALSNDTTTRNTITGQILDYFNQFSTASVVKATSVEITGGTEITENNGTLQLAATVLPDDATNKTVTWAIADGSVYATISKDGLLTASGLDNGNGVVYVTATTNDGTEISDTAAITISNQTLGEGYHVLLVNDNANGATRYYELDTALTAGGYNYKIFNAAAKGMAPSSDYLANFDFVIWYTGNDGANLYLWDVSDSTNITCNAPLKTFADNGGVVFLQGLDFLYDIYGNKYSGVNADGDSVIHTFAEGDFVYDYLGIKNYVAQSHANETSGNFKGVPQLDKTDEDSITTLDPIKWTYTEMWYVDALEPTATAVPLYYLGPETYDFSLFYAMLYNKNADAQFVTATFETARLDNQENTNQFFKEVIDYFKEQKATGIFTKQKNNFKVNLFPNPANNQISINYTLDKVENIRVQISDLSGKKLFDKSMFSTVGFQTRTIDVSNMNSGVYNINISSNSKNYNQRLVIIK